MTGQGRRTVAIVIASMAVGAAAPASASAAPEILRTALPGPQAGVPVDLAVTARDGAAPITGLEVGFGPGEGGFGLSACTLGPRGSAQPAGRAATMVVPHTYAAPGTGAAGLRVLSAGCTGPSPSAVQKVGYTVVSRGGRPVASTYSTPSILGAGESVPLLPGLDAIAALPGSPVTGTPSPLPALPPIPSVPPVLGSAASSAQLAGACPGTGAPFVADRAGLAAARRALLCLNNAERARRGLAPLRMNRGLQAAATGHSKAMYRKRFFAHTGPGSRNLRQRLGRYIPRRGGWLIGENIAFGEGRHSSPLAIHRAWMKSTAHRANILNRRFREVGFGVVKQAPFGTGATYTTNFGRRG